MRKAIARAVAVVLMLGGPALTGAAWAEDTTDITTQSGSASAWDQVKGNWIEFKGLVKERWGELTDDDLLQIQGERQQLVGRIQALYGVSLEEAESQVTEWENSVVTP